MRCPSCKNLETRVVDSRMSEDGTSIRRRRACEKCAHRFTTFERLEFVSFLVTKSDGAKELYDREKLEHSILKACNKREVDPAAVDAMVGQLEVEWAAHKQGITSKRIGRDVLGKLKNLDEVAFLRFASVYHNFSSAKDFADFIRHEVE